MNHHTGTPSAPGQPNPGQPAITARRLSVRRGHREVLRNLDFDVPRGCITGLLGPSGCGKSTLMRAIVGVQAGVDGTLDVLGQAAGSSGLRSRIGYVTQSASVYEDLTAAENLRFFGKVLGSTTADVDDALTAVGMADHRDRLVADMSGGQRSRISLAVALLGKPELLVLDEPTVGLDPVLRVELWKLFAQFAVAGVTLLVSSHVMDEAEHCDQLLLVRDGQLVATTTPARFKAETGQDTIEGAFLEAVR